MTSLHPVSNNSVKLPDPFCFVFVCQSGELEIKVLAVEPVALTADPAAGRRISCR